MAQHPSTITGIKTTAKYAHFTTRSGTKKIHQKAISSGRITFGTVAENQTEVLREGTPYLRSSTANWIHNWATDT